MLVLAGGAPHAPHLTGEIATTAAVPKRFLEQILLDLKRAGLLRSTRGRAGGYSLARPAAEIHFAEIVRAIDGPLALAPCASRTAYRRCTDCTDVATCAIRRALLDVRDATSDILEKHTLESALDAPEPLPV